MPIAIKLICSSLMLFKSTILSVRHDRVAQSDSLFNFHRHHARYALFLHGDSDQLLRHLHCNFVVADEDKLGLTRHFAHKVAETFSVTVVEGGVHLIQKAKRSGVELKQREHKR